MTPVELVQSWNALGDIVPLNNNSEFTAQAKRILSNMEIKNEIHFWNNLNDKERQIVKDQDLELEFKKIQKAPAKYANNQIKHLQRFIQPELERKETKLERLLEAEKNEEAELETAKNGEE